MKTSFGRLLAAGGAGALVFNAFFPRAADPWDPVGVLTMIADNSVRRQIAFLGVTISVLLVAGSVIRLGWDAGGVGWWGALLAGLGSVLFSAATALGLAVTGAARSWQDAGGGTESVEFATATALNRADDFVWYVSIVTLWIGFSLIGISLHRAGHVPRWSGPALAVIGGVTGTAIGVPLAFGVEWLPLIIGFGIAAVLTSVWAVVVGIRLAGKSG